MAAMQIPPGVSLKDEFLILPVHAPMCEVGGKILRGLLTLPRSTIGRLSELMR